MKTHSLFLKIAILFLLSVGPAFAAGEKESNKVKEAIKVGIGFGGSSGSYDINFDIATPSLFSIVRGDAKGRSAIALVLLGGNRFFNNIQKGSGLFTGISSPTFSLGVRSTLQIPDISTVFYTIIAADLSFMDAAVSTKSTNWGVLTTFGCDLLIEKNTVTFLGISDSSFFIEGNIHLFHSRLDTALGQPNILDGFFPRVGIRSHF